MQRRWPPAKTAAGSRYSPAIDPARCCRWSTPPSLQVARRSRSSSTLSRPAVRSPLSSRYPRSNSRPCETGIGPATWIGAFQTGNAERAELPAWRVPLRIGYLVETKRGLAWLHSQRCRSQRARTSPSGWASCGAAHNLARCVARERRARRCPAHVVCLSPAHGKQRIHRNAEAISRGASEWAARCARYDTVDHRGRAVALRTNGRLGVASRGPVSRRGLGSGRGPVPPRSAATG